MKKLWLAAVIVAATHGTALAHSAFAYGNGTVISCENKSSETNVKTCVERKCKESGANCGSPGWYSGTCLSVAKNNDNTFYNAFNKDWRIAQSETIRQCVLYGGLGCHVIFTACDKD